MPEPRFPWSRLTLWVFLVVLAGIAARQRILLLHLKTQIADTTAESQQLRRQIADLSRAAAHLRPLPPVTPALGLTQTAPRPTHPPNVVTVEEPPSEHLRETLALARADVARLDALNANLQSEIKTLTADNRRVNAAREDLEQIVTDANQTIRALRAELSANDVRLARLESASARLQERATMGKQSEADLHKSIVEIEGIFRRREMYLNNILTRYKEITEQYRALSGVRDGRPDGEALRSTNAEISRIQNTISLAEEDLKQIQVLTGQAASLQRKLP
jgi:chromosome segregation ATPase